MAKIKITENELKQIIRESINSVLNEDVNGFRGYNFNNTPAYNGPYRPGVTPPANPTKPTTSAAPKTPVQKPYGVKTPMAPADKWDGVNKPTTPGAIKDYQKKMYLRVTGVWDNQSERAWENFISKKGVDDNVLLNYARKGTRPQTKEDIMAFQRKIGTRIDGIWGPETQKAWDDYLERTFDFNKPTPYYNGQSDFKYNGQPTSSVVKPTASRPTSRSDIYAFQVWYNRNMGGSLETDGKWGPNTQEAWTKSQGGRVKRY